MTKRKISPRIQPVFQACVQIFPGDAFLNELRKRFFELKNCITNIYKQIYSFEKIFILEEFKGYLDKNPGYFSPNKGCFRTNIR